MAPRAFLGCLMTLIHVTSENAAAHNRDLPAVSVRRVKTPFHDDDGQKQYVATPPIYALHTRILAQSPTNPPFHINPACLLTPLCLKLKRNPLAGVPKLPDLKIRNAEKLNVM